MGLARGRGHARPSQGEGEVGRGDAGRARPWLCWRGVAVDGRWRGWGDGDGQGASASDDRGAATIRWQRVRVRKKHIVDRASWDGYIYISLFVESPRSGTRQRFLFFKKITLPSVPRMTLSKAFLFIKKTVLLSALEKQTLDKVYLIFFLQFFLLSFYSIYTYIFNFVTIIKVFPIPVGFSSFNWISSVNSNLNCKSLKNGK
jgi:hypothetical protein